MDESLNQGFLLGDFRVYPLDARVVGPDGEHRLSPAAMEILTTLAGSGGQVISAEHLISEVWGQTVPDSGTLEHYIDELRHLLDAGNHGPAMIRKSGDAGYQLSVKPRTLSDGADEPGFLSELKRRKVTKSALLYLVGAWLIIQVAETTLPALGFGTGIVRVIIITAIIGFPIAMLLSWFYDIRPGDGGAATATSRAGIRYIVAGALVALPLSLAYQWFYGVDTHPGADVDLQPNSIAVLSFLNLSSDENYDYFGDGLAEEILNALSSTGRMLVAPRTSSFVYKDTDTTIDVIGRQLGVRHVLEGSVRRQKNHVRVVAGLVDVIQGFQVWTQTYDAELSDIFDVQQDISQQVVRSLNIVLSPDKSAALGAARTSSVQAYDNYLQGRDYLHRPPAALTLDRAADFFDKATSLDPDYADAYAGLCDSYLNQYVLTGSGTWFAKAEESCKAALRFDLVTADIQIALGNLYRQSGQFDLAEQQLTAAISSEPQNVDAIHALALTYAAIGVPEHAESLFRSAINEQPRFWRGHQALGNFLFDTGRSTEAIPYYQEVIELTPRSAAAFNNLGAALMMANNFEEAAGAWKKSLELEATEVAYSNAGSSLFMAANFDEATEMYQRAAQLAPDKHWTWGNLADAERFSSSPGRAAEHYSQAATLAERELSINSSDSDTTVMLAHYVANINQPERARTLIAQATAEAPDNLYVWYYVALTWSTLGDLERAVQAAQKARELGYPAELLAADAGLSAATSTPEYRGSLNSADDN